MSKFFLTLGLLALQTAIAAPFAFVSCQMSGGPSTTVPDVDSVNVIDLSDNSYVLTYPYPIEFAPLAPQPFGIAITPDGKWIYVVNTGISSVCAINTATGEFVTIPVGGTPNFPGFIAITPDGKKAFVSCFNDGVLVIDVASNTVIQQILLPYLPQNIAITPDGSRAYVPLTQEISPGFGGYFVINTADYSVSGPFPVPVLPDPPNPTFIGINGIAISSDGKTAFMTNSNQSVVYKVTLQTNAVEIITNNTLQSPFLAALTPDNRFLYMSKQNGVPSVLYKMKTTFPYITKAIVLDNSGDGSVGVAVSPDGKKVVVAYENKVAVVSTETDAILDVPIIGDFDIFGPLIMRGVCISLPVPSPFPIPILPVPVSVRGCVGGNQFLSQKELFNVVTWDKPTTITPVRYQVYRDIELTCLAGEVCCPEFVDYNRRENTKNSYYIVAILGDGSPILIGQTAVCSR